jgi:hypothetical protein
MCNAKKIFTLNKLENQGLRPDFRVAMGARAKSLGIWGRGAGAYVWCDFGLEIRKFMLNSVGCYSISSATLSVALNRSDANNN